VESFLFPDITLNPRLPDNRYGGQLAMVALTWVPRPSDSPWPFYLELKPRLVGCGVWPQPPCDRYLEEVCSTMFHGMPSALLSGEWQNVPRLVMACG
jgi:hypothetical protein